MERNEWTNLRGLAIFCVIITHTMTLRFHGDNDLSKWLNLFFDQVSRFSVPVFFISSGFGLGSKYMYEIDISTFYKKRLKIIPEYIFWSVLYFLLSSSEKNLKILLFDIVTGSASGQLYFIIVLIQFYLIFPLIKRAALSNVGLILSFAITICFQVFFQMGFDFGRYYFWYWIAYFVLGIYLANHDKLFYRIKKQSKVIFLGGAMLMLCSTFLFSEFSERPINLITSTTRPSIFFYSVGIMSWFLANMSKPIKFFEILDKYSLPIYYVHMIFLKIFFMFFGILNINHDIFFILVIVVGLTGIFSLIFAIFYEYFIEHILMNLKTKI